jgi:hypothetical protein
VGLARVLHRCVRSSTVTRSDPPDSLATTLAEPSGISKDGGRLPGIGGRGCRRGVTGKSYSGHILLQYVDRMRSSITQYLVSAVVYTAIVVPAAAMSALVATKGLDRCVDDWSSVRGIAVYAAILVIALVLGGALSRGRRSIFLLLLLLGVVTTAPIGWSLTTPQICHPVASPQHSW